MSRFDSESLNAPHTQRHLDEIPQRGPSKPDFPIQAYAYTKADLNAETRELREEVERLKAELEKSKGLVFVQSLRHTSALMRAIGNRQAERDQAHEDYMALMDELNAEKALADRLAVQLKIAEAALSDIGDAEREDGDDLQWCEQRAAKAIPGTRAELAAYRKARGL